MTAPDTLVALSTWEVRLLRALIAASTIAVVVGTVLALGVDDRDDPVLVPASVCIVLGGSALVALLLVAPRWTTTIALDGERVRISRVLLPPRSLARGDVTRAVLGIVLRPSRLGPEPAVRLLLVDRDGRTRARATWSERRGRTGSARAALAAAGVPLATLPASTTARELEALHPGATSIVERHPRLVWLVAVALAVLGLLVGLAL
ncbi:MULTISPECIES: hypothetical protein [unclassified Agrococcus]|uniref:hypothetical protein n=1 Tax=unclassified Agrococcus TaxID=2615065 RepID=UPI003618025D